MNAELRPYPAYKDSGLPWLGKVPTHWDVEKAKWLFRYRKQLNRQGQERNILSLTLRGVVNNDPDKPEGLVPKDYDTYQIFEAGDLVFKLIDLENLRTSRVGLVHERGIMSPAYLRLTLRKPEDRRYFLYQFYDLYLRGIYNQLGAGVRATLGPSDLLNLPVLIPPKHEQTHIQQHLSVAEQFISRFIRNRRRLIEVLEEQKQAIISKAVTRGLDPTVPLKPSGIDWLGDIPEHWEIVPLKYLSSRIQNGATPPTNVESYYNGGTVPWYGPSSIKTDRDVRIPVKLLNINAFTEGKARLIKSPAILIVVIGATAGRMGLLLEPGATNQQITAFELRDNIVSPTFVLDQLRLAENYLRSTASTATIPILDAGIVSRLHVLVPPIKEQQAIQEWLERNTAGLLSSINSTQREIDLIREYRTRLIADVVTGKVDVRGIDVPEVDEEDLLEGNDLTEEPEEIGDEEKIFEDEE